RFEVFLRDVHDGLAVTSDDLTGLGDPKRSISERRRWQRLFAAAWDSTNPNERLNLVTGLREGILKSPEAVRVLSDEGRLEKLGEAFPAEVYSLQKRFPKKLRDRLAAGFSGAMPEKVRLESLSWVARALSAKNLEVTQFEEWLMREQPKIPTGAGGTYHFSEGDPRSTILREFERQRKTPSKRLTQHILTRWLAEPDTALLFIENSRTEAWRRALARERQTLQRMAASSETSSQAISAAFLLNRWSWASPDSTRKLAQTLFLLHPSDDELTPLRRAVAKRFELATSEGWAEPRIPATQEILGWALDSRNLGVPAADVAWDALDRLSSGGLAEVSKAVKDRTRGEVRVGALLLSLRDGSQKRVATLAKAIDAEEDSPIRNQMMTILDNGFRYDRKVCGEVLREAYHRGN
ncbi:MAG: hypothetical protein AAB425_14735, partial [Bdellovibrionota bacterium]